MTNTYAPPSRNPTNDGSLLGLFDFILFKFLQNFVDDMLPAQIVAYNRTTNLAQVQPLISMVRTNGQIVQRSEIQSVPVLQLGGGGFTLNFPINPGDLGWIKANDRDISLFKQLWSMVIPNTARKHNFSDSIFIPSVMTGFTIESQDTGNVVLQSSSGGVRLSMGNGNVCISDISSYSQSVNAILDLQSTSRAFKFPAMTTTQKNAIENPLLGFAVFDITKNGLSIYTTSGWS